MVLSLRVATVRSQAEVLREALTFFGTHGVGLQLRDSACGGLTFVGRGGFVCAVVGSERNPTVVDIATRAFECPVEESAALLSLRDDDLVVGEPVSESISRSALATASL